MYALFELAYTATDFMAAVLFVIGSILFFDGQLQHIGTWFFLIGSILFAVKPTLRMVREITLYRMGDLRDLANKAQNSDEKGD